MNTRLFPSKTFSVIALCNALLLPSAACTDVYAEDNSSTEKSKATGTVVQTYIKDAWIRNDALYVLYDREVAIEHPFHLNPLNPHDSGTEYVDEMRYQTYKIESIKTGQLNSISVNDGILVAGLRYVDEDFQARLVGKRAYIRNRAGEVAVRCDWEFWNFATTVRIGDTLFYCGYAIRTTEIRPRKVSDELQNQIRAHVDTERRKEYRKAGLKKSNPVVAFLVKTKTHLYAVGDCSDRAPQNEYKLCPYFSIDIHSLTADGPRELRIRADEHLLSNTEPILFASGFVVGSRLPESDKKRELRLSICVVEECDRLEKHQLPSLRSARVLINDEQTIAIYFEDTGESSGKYRVRSVDFREGKQ